jgi:hypothetical protein
MGATGVGVKIGRYVSRLNRELPNQSPLMELVLPISVFPAYKRGPTEVNFFLMPLGFRR